MRNETFRRALLAGAIVCALGGTAAPTAVAGVAGAQAERAAVGYLGERSTALGMARADIGEARLASSYTTAHNGVSHVYLQQQYRGIEVWGGIFNVSLLPGGDVLGSGSTFVPGLARSAGRQMPRLTAAQALGQVAADNLQVSIAGSPPRILQRPIGPDQRTVLSEAGIAAKPIEAKLVWYPLPEGGVRLAWELDIEEVDGQNWWQAIVDAQTGSTLEMHNLVIHDSAEAIAAATDRPLDAGASALVHDHGHASPARARIGAKAEQPISPYGFETTDGAVYRVFPMPLENPADGGPQLVTDVADPLGSPLGWHDTGTTQYTVTRGNNVHAYADRAANNQPDPGSDPDGGAALVFDFPFDLTAQPIESQPAIVTNLFYWNNVIHDVTYRYGFTEAAGNFQVNNFGQGGAGGDDVRAEAQDGSGVNNANFSTPADGSRPRMQMFEWLNALPAKLTITGSAAAGAYVGPPAGFGPRLIDTGPVTGPVVLVDDGSATPNEGCSAYSLPADSVALVYRGTCPFADKVLLAQNAGAVAVVVVNNIEGDPIAMGGTANGITIPSLMVSLADGTRFRDNLPATATLEDGSMGLPDRDSDLDAGVIAHEYGHGISNRLTGGRTVVNCLNNAEQMGEGWSDWFGITMTVGRNDNRRTPRGVGTYLSFQSPTGRGIRPAPYSTDLAVSRHTYADVADTLNISQPHGIGYIWNAMLWEVFWNLTDKHGMNPNIYDDWDTGGNNLAFQLVMDGMAIQQCRPGMVDGRDAILAADVALGGNNQCEIWRGFAKRGLGASADQGSPQSRTDGVEAFDLPAQCLVSSFEGFDQPTRTDIRNRVVAGRVLPVSFRVDGETDAIAVDSQGINCHTRLPLGDRPVAIASSGNGITPAGGSLQVEWSTDPTWKASCRRLTVRVPGEADGVTDYMFF